jgi:hypothetical protein
MGMGDPQNYKGIPQPVSDFFVTVKLQPSRRYGRSLDYVKTDRRYLIELRFHSEVDLALFEKFIQHSPVRLIEYQTKDDRQSRFFVTDSRMKDDGGWEAAWRWVYEELPRSGTAIAIHFPQFVLPECRCIIDLQHENGHIAAMPPPVNVRIVGTVNLPSLDALLTDTSGRLLHPFLAMCDNDADFREAVMYCGQALRLGNENPWASLYRAYEVVADRFGGDKVITTDIGLCSQRQLERFKRTLNHQEAIGAFSRHARSDHAPPPDPMVLNEALEFVLALVREWQRPGT